MSGSSPARGTINTETGKTREKASKKEKVPEHTGGDAKEQQQQTGEPRREIALPWWLVVVVAASVRGWTGGARERRTQPGGTRRLRFRSRRSSSWWFLARCLRRRRIARARRALFVIGSGGACKQERHARGTPASLERRAALDAKEDACRRRRHILPQCSSCPVLLVL